MRIHSGIDSAKLKRINNLFGSLEKETQKITGRASRRVAERVKGFISSYVSKEYYIDEGQITPFIKIFRGGLGQEASLHIRGSKLSLMRFHTTASRVVTLRAGVLRGNSKAIPRAFYKVGKSSNPHVFAVKKDALGTPKERKKTGITVLRGPSIPQMAGTARGIEKIEKFMRAEVEKELNPAIENILRGV